MALLTQPSGSVQLLPAMTSTNWKRPWTDVDDHTSQSPRPTQSPWSASSPPDQRQYHDIASTSREWRPHFHPQAAPSSNGEGAPRALPGPSHSTNGIHHSPYDADRKRARLFPPESRPLLQTREDSGTNRMTPLNTPPSTTGMLSLNRSGEQVHAGAIPHDPSSIESQRPPEWSSHAGMLKEEGLAAAGARWAQCAVCSAASSKTPHIVEGLSSLHEDLAKLLLSDSSPADKRSDSTSEKRNTYAPKGLLDSLDWSLEKLNDSIELARGVLSSGRTQEQGHNYRSMARDRAPSSIGGEHTSQAGGTSSRAGISPVADDGNNPRDLPPMRLDEHSRRPSPVTAQELRPYATHVSAQQPRSPTVTGQPSRSSARPLPSPSSLNFSAPNAVLPPISSPSILSHQPPTPSTTGPSPLSLSRSPHNSHLQELQHQLSTKSLAHSVLAFEHEKLLAAYSRSQTRCATLDRKTCVSENEIGNLVEDKIRLQGQLEMAEEELMRLQVRQEESGRREEDERAQWLRILRGSEELQHQWTAEERRWRRDRDVWERERRELQTGLQRGLGAEGAKETMPSIKWESGTMPQESQLPSLRATETDEQLRAQLRLWQSKAEAAERKNEQYQTELGSLRRVVGELVGLDSRLTAISGSNE